jgi:transketolase
MLNPDLKLNSKIFDLDVEKDATRSGYGAGLIELGTQDPNVVVLCADLTESTKADKFAKAFPERFFQVGVAEQNMAAIAAGLGVSGKTAFISSYATFSPGKNWETIRTTIVYNESNVKIAGHHAGIMTGPDGATHQATEDIASVRALPIIKIIVPCDSVQGRLATIHSGKDNGPYYLRFSRDKTPIITTDDTPFEFGKAQTFWTVENPQAVIFATGYMVYYALVAAKELEEEGIQILVTNIHTIKPLDEATIIAQAKQTGAVVSVEDHQVAGGLGSAIAEVLSKNFPTPQEFIGLQNTFGESGTPIELIEKYGMGTQSIKDTIKKVIARKYKI